MDESIWKEDEPETATYSTAPARPVSRRRRGLGAFALLVFLAATLAIGAIGGTSGFVVLANTRSPFFENLREKLGIDDASGVAVPIRQTVKLEENSTVIDAAKKVQPAVVSISTSATVQNFFGQTSTQEVSGGTGFIITSDGLIVTNKHVIDTANATYKVVLDDGRIFDATIQAEDTLNDFAVIKIDAKDLPTVELGSSDDLQVGQYVLAIGNALGEFKNSVSLGIVSAKGRSISAGSSDQGGSEKLTDLIQTDAAINPGNSGGPLVNMAGQVVGIDTAIASNGSDGSIGIGFALPIDDLKTAIDSVRKTGIIERPYLGVRYRIVDTSYQQLTGLAVDHGALLAIGTDGSPAVVSGSPADKAGLKQGDVILEINGERIDDDNSVADRLRSYKVGDTVTLKVYRGGNTIEVKVTLGKQS